VIFRPQLHTLKAQGPSRHVQRRTIAARMSLSANGLPGAPGIVAALQGARVADNHSITRFGLYSALVRRGR